VDDAGSARAAGPTLDLSPAAEAEWRALQLEGAAPGLVPVPLRAPLPRRRLSAPAVLNEAFDYARPASFSRGVGLDLPGVSVLFLSGTASVDEHGATVHAGDFKAQCLRTFRNLAGLLSGAGASWHDVVRTTCYLRDIERDYEAFNEVRTAFLGAIGLDPLPASTGIQARLCRSDLLIEIEAIAMVPRS